MYTHTHTGSGGRMKKQSNAYRASNISSIYDRYRDSKTEVKALPFRKKEEKFLLANICTKYDISQI